MEQPTLWAYPPPSVESPEARHRHAPHNGTATSKLAAESLSAHTLNALEAIVLATIGEHGPITCDGVEVRTGLSHQTCSARFTALAAKRRIVEAGSRAPTRSGRGAEQWIVA